MDYLQTRNIHLLLEWRRKWHTGYCGLDPWAGLMRQRFDVDFGIKRFEARCWLVARKDYLAMVERKRARAGNVIPFSRRK
jgi:hypothetical protein